MVKRNEPKKRPPPTSWLAEHQLIESTTLSEISNVVAFFKHCGLSFSQFVSSFRDETGPPPHILCSIINIKKLRPSIESRRLFFGKRLVILPNICPSPLYLLP